MDYSLFNRSLVGLILIAIVTFSYFFKLEYFLISVLILLITYDFLFNNLINKFILIFLPFSSILLILLVPFNIFQNIFIIQVFLIFSILYFYDYKKFFFILSLYIFCLILFYIASSDRNLFYLLIFISFFNDTTAFIFGKFINGPLIVPSISPKKTWSGTLISFLFTTCILLYFDFNILISIFISAFLFIGDIFFSYMKRYLDLKDFSVILKSHGGILDRLDSMFFVSIILQFYLVYLL